MFLLYLQIIETKSLFRPTK